MTTDPALNLSDIDPPKWRVQVNGTVYGPYTLGQMQGFARERRIGPHTKVSDRETGSFGPAGEVAALKDLFAAHGKAEETPAGEPANYLVIARLAETDERQLLGALNRLGKFAQVMPGVWALRSSVRQTHLRQALAGVVSPEEQVMIANASTGRLAWVNLGPEADAHIRSIWDADLSA
ncbi:GYF domain-containing protein [Henriciella aquimarina]|uniref:GYF domain-containing protein n=1 Tax=Henriciella aquimarina TaxID=545261 RepID=UPI0009FC40C6|nr:GYF domain-containing protein [Henriciella aquimarina]